MPKGPSIQIGNLLVTRAIQSFQAKNHMTQVLGTELVV